MGCIDLSLKYGMGWTCHKKMVRFLIPLDQKWSANLFHGHLAITFSVRIAVTTAVAQPVPQPIVSPVPRSHSRIFK